MASRIKTPAAALPVHRDSVARSSHRVKRRPPSRREAWEALAAGLVSGTRVRQSRGEEPSMRTIERLRTRKNAPVTPPRSTNGRKIASEQRLEPARMGAISALAGDRVAGGSPVDRAAR